MCTASNNSYLSAILQLQPIQNCNYGKVFRIKRHTYVDFLCAWRVVLKDDETSLLPSAKRLAQYLMIQPPH